MLTLQICSIYIFKFKWKLFRNYLYCILFFKWMFCSLKDLSTIVHLILFFRRRITIEGNRSMGFHFEISRLLNNSCRNRRHPVCKGERFCAPCCHTVYARFLSEKIIGIPCQSDSFFILLFNLLFSFPFYAGK